jgi:EAL domain-containing protein (putative c-di-GMP-specific phosphodiesterase class I)
MVTLRKLSACRLKIDRSFIRDMLHDVNDEMIVKATIALAQSLGLEVVAEGVESKEQLAVLKKQGCDFAQGYFLGFPMKSSDTINFLRLLDRKTVKRYRSYKYSPKYV